MASHADGIGILGWIMIVGIVILCIPTMLWMVALHKFGHAAELQEANTSFAILFCFAIQAVCTGILWVTSGSFFKGFFAAYGVNLFIAVMAFILGLLLGHNPFPLASH